MPSNPLRRAWVVIAVVVGWIAVSALLQLLRVSDGVPAWRTIWAEDGGFFLPRALEHPLSSVFTTHAGYYQLLSRLIALPMAGLPVGWSAAVLAIGGAVSASLLSVYVYWVSDSVFRTQWARVLMAALMLFTPVAVSEVSVNGVDAHWYLLFACFWALWSTGRSRARLVADAVVVGLATVSTPLVVFYAPLVLRRFLREPGRGRMRWVVPALFVAGVLAQGIHVLTNPHDTQITPVIVRNMPHFFLVRVVGGFLIGNIHLKTVWVSLGKTFEALAFLVVAGVATYGLVVSKGDRRLFIAAAAFYAALLTVVALYTRGSGVPIAYGALDLANVRYTFVPILLLTAAFIAVADSPQAAPAMRVIPVAVVIGVAVVNAVGFRFAREDGPAWDKALAAARVQCRAGAAVVQVPVTPRGWTARVRCDRLLGD